MTQYAVLFQVEIGHDFSLNQGEIVHEALSLKQQQQVMAQYNLDSWLSITPTTTTVRTLAGQQMLFKATTSGFLVGVKLDPTVDLQPFISLPSTLKLTFALQVRDPYFFNYTALTGEALPFHWFSNASGNGMAGQMFLSQPVPAFDPQRAYRADDLYSEPAGDTINLFRALQETGPMEPPISGHWVQIPVDTFDPNVGYEAGVIVLADNQTYRSLQQVGAGSDVANASLWEPVTTLSNQYVTSADILPLRPSQFNLDLSSATLNTATVRLFRRDSTTVAWEQMFEVEDGALETVQLALRALAADCYRLEVLNGDLTPLPELGFEFYLDEAAVRDRWFGVITIGLGSDEFALLDESGQVRSPSYRLRFLNRASRWRYRFPADQPLPAVADLTQESSDNDQVWVTTQPRPLTRYGTGFMLRADDPNTEDVSEEILLPEPNINRIQHHETQWYSDIYLSNFAIDSFTPSP
jgi:hypothetical protein